MKHLLVLVIFLLTCSHCMADEETGIIRFEVSEDVSIEDKFESYATLMTCLGVEIETEEIPLYYYYHSTDFWDDDSKEEYLSMIQKSLAVKPNSGRLMNYLGDYYHHLENNKEEWIRYYQKAYEIKPCDIEISLSYLTVCNELDDEENATKVFLKIKNQLQPVIRSSENEALINKAGSLYAGALSEVMILCSRHHSFSLVDQYLDELFSLPLTVFSRYACGFDALDHYFDLSEQLNNQDKTEFCAQTILKLYDEAKLVYTESSYELFLLSFIYGNTLTKADDYIDSH